MSPRYSDRNFAVGLSMMFLSLLSTSVIASGEIQRNPFARPPIEVLLEQNLPVIERQEPEWRPELRAVLVAGEKSVVDLGGVILQVGESTSGYRLVAVGEGTATFSRDGERVVISLYEQEFRE